MKLIVCSYLNIVHLVWLWSIHRIVVGGLYWNRSVYLVQGWCGGDRHVGRCGGQKRNAAWLDYQRLQIPENHYKSNKVANEFTLVEKILNEFDWMHICKCSTWAIMNRETRRLSKIPDEVRQELQPFYLDRAAIATENMDTQNIQKLSDQIANRIRTGLAVSYYYY